MKRFKSARQAQCFLSVYELVANLFHIPRPEHQPAELRRAARERVFVAWAEIVGVALAAQTGRRNSTRLDAKNLS